MPDLGHNNDFKFVKDAEMASGKRFKYATSETFTDPLDVVTKEYVDSAPFQNLDQNNFFCVGKAGNDSNNGRSENEALLTIGAAIAKAVAEVPTNNNQFIIRIIDGGKYNENITLPAFVYIHGPGAIIEGQITCTDVEICGVLCDTLISPSGVAALNITRSILYINVMTAFVITDGPGIIGFEANISGNINKILGNGQQFINNSLSKSFIDIKIHEGILRGVTSGFFELNDVHLSVSGYSLSTENSVLFVLNNSSEVYVNINRILSFDNKIYDILDSGSTFLLSARLYDDSINSTAIAGATVSLNIGYDESDLKARMVTTNGSVFDTDVTYPEDKIIQYSLHPTFTLNTQLVDKQYVDEHTSNSIWNEDVPGNQIEPQDDGRDLNMLSGGYKDNNVISPILLGDASNAVYNTLNQTHLGSNNETLTNLLSAGYLSGGALTDNLNGSVNIASGSGYIRESNSGTAVLKYFTWDAVTNLAFVDESNNIIYVDYNGGVPIVTIGTDETLVTENENNLFELYTGYREGTELHITQQYQYSNNTIRLIQQRFFDVEKVGYAQGIFISGTGTRNVFTGAGRIWVKLDRIDIPQIDTSAGDNFDRYYRDGVGGWIKQNNVTQWDNNNFDNGSGTLQPMTANNWSNQYFYIQTDGSLTSIYGQDQFSSEALAKGESRPAEAPGRIANHALYVGRVTFEAGAALGDFQTAFEDTTGLATVRNHDELGARDLPTNHTNSAYLPGRDGGQVLNGGTQSGESLTLVSTSDAVKGSVFISDGLDYFRFKPSITANDIFSSQQNINISADSTDTETSVSIRGNNAANGRLVIGRGNDANNKYEILSQTTSIANEFGSSITEFNINNTNNDVDIKIKGTTDDNLFNTDAANDTVRIGNPFENNISRLKIQGTVNTVQNGIEFETTQDQYPVYSVLPYAHNFIGIFWDCYFDGASFISSNATLNYINIKATTGMTMFQASGGAPGSPVGALTKVYGLDSVTNGVSLSVGASVNEISTDDTMSSPTDNQLSTTLAIQQHVENHIVNGIWQKVPGAVTTIFPKFDVDVLNFGGNDREIWVGKQTSNLSVTAEYHLFTDLSTSPEILFTFTAPGKYWCTLRAPDEQEAVFDIAIYKTGPVTREYTIYNGFNCTIVSISPSEVQITAGSFYTYLLNINLTNGEGTLRVSATPAIGDTVFQATVNYFNV